MALVITTPIGYKKQNEAGVTSEVGVTSLAYIVIDNVQRSKDGKEKVTCRTFKSKADRDLSYENSSELQVESYFVFSSDNPDTDYTKTLGEYFGALYAKIAAKYAELGLTTQNI